MSALDDLTKPGGSWTDTLTAVQLGDPSIDSSLAEYFNTLGKELAELLSSIYLKDVAGTEISTALQNNGIRADLSSPMDALHTSPANYGLHAEKALQAY